MSKKELEKEVVEQNIISKDGESYTVITLTSGEKVDFRHPKGRDVRVAMDLIKKDSELALYVASSATCKSIDELDEMPAKDLVSILKVTSGFLA